MNTLFIGEIILSIQAFQTSNAGKTVYIFRFIERNLQMMLVFTFEYNCRLHVYDIQ